jgi:hypothetical protein
VKKIKVLSLLQMQRWREREIWRNKKGRWGNLREKRDVRP